MKNTSQICPTGNQGHHTPECLPVPPAGRRSPLRRPVAVAVSAAVLCMAWLALPGGPAHAGTAAAREAVAPMGGSVGEITLVIGRPQLQRDGALQAVRKGDLIYPRDTLLTGDNGHLHIRFIDNARLSVRPQTRFVITEFNYDPAAPAAATVRFDLQEGEARTISGAAAHAARERFRLNTPLVAIGVKGTDFITRAAAGAAVATVNEGAIVMAPFDQKCTIDGLGACNGPLARELTETMGGVALVYRRDGAADAAILLVPARRDEQKIQLLDQGERSRAADRGTVALVESRAEAGIDQVAVPNRLIWGRWGDTALPGDTLTRPFLEALAGNEVTVGDGYYFLFREKGVPNLLGGLDGQVDFKLAAAAASYRQPGTETRAASVGEGRLAIDFARSTYSTQLALAVPAVGEQTFAVQGSIDKAGIFLGNDGQGARLAGALTLDGRQAGYLFSQPLGSGVVTGATQWQQPSR